MLANHGAMPNEVSPPKGASGSFATSSTRRVIDFEMGASLQSQASEPSTTPEPREIAFQNSSESTSPIGNWHNSSRRMQLLQESQQIEQQQQMQHLYNFQQRDVKEIQLERPHMNFLASLAVARLALAQWASRVVTLSNLHPEITCYHLADTFEAFGSVAYAHGELRVQFLRIDCFRYAWPDTVRTRSRDRRNRAIALHRRRTL